MVCNFIFLGIAICFCAWPGSFVNLIFFHRHIELLSNLSLSLRFWCVSSGFSDVLFFTVGRKPWMDRWIGRICIITFWLRSNECERECAWIGRIKTQRNKLKVCRGNGNECNSNPAEEENRGKTATKLSHLIKLYRSNVEIELCAITTPLPCDELKLCCNSFGCNDIFQLFVALSSLFALLSISFFALQISIPIFVGWAFDSLSHCCRLISNNNTYTSTEWKRKRSEFNSNVCGFFFVSEMEFREINMRPHCKDFDLMQNPC